MKKLFFSVICAVFACFAARAQNTEYRLSTHILDIGTGMPAPNVAVKLFRQSAGGEWTEIADGITDSNGRISPFGPKQFGNIQTPFCHKRLFRPAKTKLRLPLYRGRLQNRKQRPPLPYSDHRIGQRLFDLSRELKSRPNFNLP